MEKFTLSQEMPPDWHKAREDLLKGVESNTEGLNMGRCNAFLASNGFTPKEALFFFESEYQTIRDRLQAAGFERFHDFSDNSNAVYYPELNLCFVNRDSEMETLNSPVYTEGLYIHEQFHASSGYNAFRYEKTGPDSRSVHVPRLGFSLRTEKENKGFFWEEAFADWYKGQYVGRYLDEEHKAKIWQRIIPDKPGRSFEQTSAKVTTSGGDYTVPFPYLYWAAEGSPSFSISSIPAAALENIIQAHPEVMEAMLTARTDVDKLRELVRILDNILPGLYAKLRDLAYAEEDFVSGYLMVKQALEAGG